MSASIIRDIERDASPVTNVNSCCNLCHSNKTEARFKNKKKKRQTKKMNENKKKQYKKINKRRQNKHLNKKI